jgi:uncharacterized protein DUF1320
MANPLAVTPHASGPETSSGQGAAVDLQPLRSAVRLTLQITAVSGTSQILSVTIQTSADGSTGWRTVGSFPSGSNIEAQKVTLADLDRWIRVAWTVAGSGSPSFTFSVSGEAHVVYAGPADIQRFALPEVALTSVEPGFLAEQCIAATGEADARLPPRYTLPLAAWGDDLRARVAQIAAYLVLKHRGFNPELGNDQLIVIEKKEAEAWLSKAGAGTITPSGIVDATPAKRGGAPRVFNRPSRGWNDDSSDC